MKIHVVRKEDSVEVFLTVTTMTVITDLTLPLVETVE